MMTAMAGCDLNSSLCSSPHPFSMATGNVRRRSRCGSTMTSRDFGDRRRHQSSVFDGAMATGEDGIDADTSGSGRPPTGQWVTLSKSLLMQLVEHLCQLSFQTDAVPPYGCPAAGDQTAGPDAQTGIGSGGAVPLGSPSRGELTAAVGVAAKMDVEEADAESTEVAVDVEADVDIDEVFSDDAKRKSVAAVGETIACDEAGSRVGSTAVRSSSSSSTPRSPSAGGSEDALHPRRHTPEVEQQSSSAAASEPSIVDDDGGGEKLELGSPRRADDDTGPRGTSTSGGDCSATRRNGTLTRRRFLHARRRDMSASKADRMSASAAARGRRRPDEASRMQRQQHRGSVNCQPWMALDKEIVLCAIDRELSSSAVNDDEAYRKSKPIWNPATSLSRFEASKWSTAEAAAARNDEGQMDVTSGGRTGCAFDATTGRSPWRQSAGVEDAHRRSIDASLGNSSMLSALLGFDSDVISTVPSAPTAISRDVSGTLLSAGRQRHVSAGGGNETPPPTMLISRNEYDRFRLSYDYFRTVVDHSATAGAAFAGSGCAVGLVGDTTPPTRCSTSSVLDCGRSTTQTSPARIWRPAEPSSADPKTKTLSPAAASASRSSPRWVAVDKGDVCSLVDSLVSTLIADGESVDVDCGAANERRPNEPTSVRCDSPGGTSSGELPSPSSSSLNEPRKWKSDLLLRVRNEKQ